jgi:hypothetical protein
VLAAALAVGVFVATSTTDDTGILAGIVLFSAAAGGFITPKLWGGIALAIGLPTLVIEILRANPTAVIVLVIAAVGAWIGSFVRTTLRGEPT